MATDLDGTLLDAAGALSARTIDALHAARAAGWFVVLATGRPAFMIHELMGDLGGAVTHGVLANGSVVCTLPDHTVLHSTRFAVDVVRTVVAGLRREDSGYGFALATDAGFAHERGFAERMPIAPHVPAAADALVAADGAVEAIKLMVFHERIGAHELLTLLPTVLPTLFPTDSGPSLSVTHMGADCVEVGPAGIDKAVGLSWLCEQLEVAAHDVVAFGDEFNDHEMMQWAGHAVAMGNATQVTKDLADEVTATNADDGVAMVIERLLATGAP